MLKYLILLGDGMADYPLENYGHRTPLEIAHTPAMDEVVRRGVLGQFCPIPEGMPPGSDIGNLSMFGYNPRNAFRGRAPIEAASQGIDLASDEVAFRCNLVTLDNGTMDSFTANHISTEEAVPIIKSLNEALADKFPVKFYPGVSYRHLCIIKGTDQAPVEALNNLECEPPHNITDQKVHGYLPQGTSASMLHEMMACARDILADHPVNKARQGTGNPPATDIWLWGQGIAPKMRTFAEKFGISGAVVSAVDLVRGMGVCAGLEVLQVPGATGWIDTNYQGKVEAGLNALKKHDFVFIHLEAPDETAHQGRADLKIQAIEDFDQKIVAPCLKWLDTHPDARILVAPDHFTLISTKTHAGGPVPFALCGAGVVANHHQGYSEREAAETTVLLEDGYTLVQRMITEEHLDFSVAVPLT